MSFSKSEMQKELLKFLDLFGKDIARLYGLADCAWTETEAVQESPIWVAANAMYDYGMMGIPTEELYPGGHIYGVYGHVERLLSGTDTAQMRLYLEESDNAPPRLTLLAVRSAVARMVLDGGWRHTDYSAGEYGAINGDMNHLTLAEVALLANMDERSVRNAANPKLADPLKTEHIGKRSLVSPEEARRWLAGRKGFIATQECKSDPAQRPPEFSVNISEELFETFDREAKKEGISLMKYVENFLAKNKLRGTEK